jgi:uncharacterized protein YbbC (DUF1343 family)
VGSVRIGIDRLLDGAAAHLKDARSALVHHPASVTSAMRNSAGALREGGFRLERLFGPQHGARGDKQDNMIESAHGVDAQTGLPVFSLYGDVRQPTPEMLDGLDVLLFDLQDVGVRVYTFAWTMALAMRACGEAGVRFVVLDRPNPVGGVDRSGPVLRSGYESFVGLYPIPLRHGLTLGELARWLVTHGGVECDLEVISCEGWAREVHWPDTGLPWVLPSPNLPTYESCRVYPGMVLLEGTNLSEGRGTTRPFELFGAPYLEPWSLVRHLAGKIPGAIVRPCHFEPTFQKHAGLTCGGGQIHVVDPTSFDPVQATLEILAAVRTLAPDAFAWRPPPYEYEERLLPIDILWGHDGLRNGIDGGVAVASILAEAAGEVSVFERDLEPILLYD